MASTPTYGRASSMPVTGCSCCAPAPTSGLQIGRRPEPAADPVVSTLTVEGMTCGGCASRVTTSLKKSAGVTDVKVSLASDGPSTVVVTSEMPPVPGELRQAVISAGYVPGGH